MPCCATLCSAPAGDAPLHAASLSCTAGVPPHAPALCLTWPGPAWPAPAPLQEHLFLVCELLRANLYEFQKYNRESGDEPYFSNARIQSIARQVLRSLAFLHSLGLIHSDLKPENILIKSYSRCGTRALRRQAAAPCGPHVWRAWPHQRRGSPLVDGWMDVAHWKEVLFIPSWHAAPAS